jgi:membrane protein implicated in regulation of membrane protease activity
MPDAAHHLPLFFAGCAGFSGLFLFIAAVNGAFHSHVAHPHPSHHVPGGQPLSAGHGGHALHAPHSGHGHHAAGLGKHVHVGQTQHHLHLGKHVQHVHTSHAAGDAHASHSAHDSQLHQQSDHHGHSGDHADHDARVSAADDPGHSGVGARLGGYWLGLTSLAVRSLNLYAILTFLFYFGVAGFVLGIFVHLPTGVLFTVATVFGVLAALLCTAILHRLFDDTAGLVTHENSRLRGREVNVTHRIRDGGTGEVIFIPRGGVAQNIPARSLDGKAIPVGQRAVIVEISDGVALVERLTLSVDVATGEDDAAV